MRRPALQSPMNSGLYLLDIFHEPASDSVVSLDRPRSQISTGKCHVGVVRQATGGILHGGGETRPVREQRLIDKMVERQRQPKKRKCTGITKL